MTAPQHTWSMRSGDRGRVVKDDVTVRAKYTLTGAASGAPHTITYWRLGESLRAEDSAGLVLVAGTPGGDVVVRGVDGALVRVGPGGLLPPLPAPELDALASAEQAAAWLDRGGAPLSRTKGVHAATGRPSVVSTWRLHALRVVADAETECVLDLDADGLRGPVAIRTSEFVLQDPDPDLFVLPQLG